MRRMEQEIEDPPSDSAHRDDDDSAGAEEEMEIISKDILTPYDDKKVKQQSARLSSG